MTRPAEITTDDIEFAAALMTVINSRPLRIAMGKRQLVEFTFPSNEITDQTSSYYAHGLLTLEVRRLAKNRSWLYRQARDISRSGVGVSFAN